MNMGKTDSIVRNVEVVPFVNRINGSLSVGNV